MEISFGGCLSVTSGEAPLNICVSLMRSSTWSRKRWCLRAAGEVAPSRTKCRAREEEEAAEVSIRFGRFVFEKGDILVREIRIVTFSVCRCVWWPWQRNDWPRSRPATAAAGQETRETSRNEEPTLTGNIHTSTAKPETIVPQLCWDVYHNSPLQNNRWEKLTKLCFCTDVFFLFLFSYSTCFVFNSENIPVSLSIDSSEFKKCIIVTERLIYSNMIYIIRKSHLAHWNTGFDF